MEICISAYIILRVACHVQLLSKRRSNAKQNFWKLRFIDVPVWFEFLNQDRWSVLFSWTIELMSAIQKYYMIHNNRPKG